jgi:uncharacterized membrane protein YdjX (TVP38/TMEM64 family)
MTATLPADWLLRRAIGDRTWDGILRGTAIIALGAIGIILWLPGATTLVVFLLLSLGCHGPLSPFLPAAYEPILLLYGQLYPPLVIALLGALTSAAAEYLNYHLYRALLSSDSLARVLRSDAARPVTALFGRRPFLAIWICAWSPLPDWAARILATHTRYPVRRYLAAFVVGRIPKFWLLAEVGLHWMPSGGTVLAIVIVSAGITILGLRRRRRAREPLERRHTMTRLTTAALIAALAAAVPALGAQDEPPRKGAFLRVGSGARHVVPLLRGLRLQGETAVGGEDRGPVLLMGMEERGRRSSPADPDHAILQARRAWPAIPSRHWRCIAL